MIYNNLAIYEGIRKCLMSCQQGGTGEQRYRSNSIQYLIGESIPWILPTKLRPRDYQLLARPATTGRVTPELEMVAVTTVIFITVWQVPPMFLTDIYWVQQYHAVFPPTTNTLTEDMLFLLQCRNHGSTMQFQITSIRRETVSPATSSCQTAGLHF